MAARDLGTPSASHIKFGIRTPIQNANLLQKKLTPRQVGTTNKDTIKQPSSKIQLQPVGDNNRYSQLPPSTSRETQYHNEIQPEIITEPTKLEKKGNISKNKKNISRTNKQSMSIKDRFSILFKRESKSPNKNNNEPTQKIETSNPSTKDFDNELDLLIESAIQKPSHLDPIDIRLKILGPYKKPNFNRIQQELINNIIRQINNNLKDHHFLSLASKLDENALDYMREAIFQISENNEGNSNSKINDKMIKYATKIFNLSQNEIKKLHKAKKLHLNERTSELIQNAKGRNGNYLIDLHNNTNNYNLFFDAVIAIKYNKIDDNFKKTVNSLPKEHVELLDKIVDTTKQHLYDKKTDIKPKTITRTTMSTCTSAKKAIQKSLRRNSKNREADNLRQFGKTPSSRHNMDKLNVSPLKWKPLSRQ